MTAAHPKRHAGRGFRRLSVMAMALALGGAVSLSASAAPGAALAPPASTAPAIERPLAVQFARGITKEQFIARVRQRAAARGGNPDQAAAIAPRLFDMIDTNHDGLITREEAQAFRAAHPGLGQGGGQGFGAGAGMGAGMGPGLSQGFGGAPGGRAAAPQ